MESQSMSDPQLHTSLPPSPMHPVHASITLTSHNPPPPFRIPRLRPPRNARSSHPNLASRGVPPAVDLCSWLTHRSLAQIPLRLSGLATPFPPSLPTTGFPEPSAHAGAPLLIPILSLLLRRILNFVFWVQPGGLSADVAALVGGVRTLWVLPRPISGRFLWVFGGSCYYQSMAWVFAIVESVEHCSTSLVLGFDGLVKFVRVITGI